MIISLILLGCLVAILAAIFSDIYGREALAIIVGSLSLLSILGYVLLLPGYPVKVSLGYYGINSSIYIDDFSAILILNTTILGIVSLVSSYKYIKLYGRRNILYYTLLLMLIYSTIGALVVNDWLGFLIFWEAISVSSYLLIIYNYREGSVRNAGTTYILSCHIGAVLLIIGIALLYSMTGSLSMNTLITPVAGYSMIKPLLSIALVLAFLGFAVKAGLAPLHYWVPYVYSATPIPILVLLSGIVDEVGVYGFYRLSSMIKLPQIYMSYLVGSMAILSMVIALMAYWVQRDFKRLFAWSTIDNIGWLFIPLAIACYVVLPSKILGQYLALYVLNHGIAKAAAFLTIGYLIYVYGSRNIDGFKGLLYIDRAAAFIVAASLFALEGVPPFNLFFSKLSILQICFATGFWYIALLMAALWCLAFIYYILLFNRICLERTSDPIKRRVEKTPLSIYVPIIVLIIIAAFSNFIGQAIIFSKGWSW